MITRAGSSISVMASLSLSKKSERQRRSMKNPGIWRRKQIIWWITGSCAVNCSFAEQSGIPSSFLLLQYVILRPGRFEETLTQHVMWAFSNRRLWAPAPARALSSILEQCTFCTVFPTSNGSQSRRCSLSRRLEKAHRLLWTGDKLRLSNSNWQQTNQVKFFLLRSSEPAHIFENIGFTINFCCYVFQKVSISQSL